MINTLDDYIWRSLPELGVFATNSNLEKKVDPTGRFLPYYGNTTVFLLEESVKSHLRSLQNTLYESAGWMLAEPVQSSTFHMTLHDLVNGPVEDPLLTANVAAAADRAKNILQQFSGQPPIKMQATWLFNMVNTSVVLGLRPTDCDSWTRLDSMYTALQQVVPLGYGLTPHITMAYFRPGCYTQPELQGLRSALRPIQLEVELSADQLVLQNFSDMNTYWNK